MNFIYDYTHSGIAAQELHAITARLRNNVLNIYIPDAAQLAVIEQCIEAKQKLEVSSLWVIGIGGSNMGALAVYSALKHLTNELPVYWVDTLDSLVTADLLACFKQELAAGKKPLVVIISKSGTTLETVVNADLFLDVLRKHNSVQYANFVVAITDKDSALWQKAQKNKYAVLEIPKHVGGRYSVFTAVGLFPLGMLGIPLRELYAGALQAVHKNTDAATQAAIIYAQYKSGKNIYDHFVFGPRLKYLGEWYRQLMGESLGKNRNVGITPTVSMGSVDLHSVAQLYLAGPQDKFTCFLLAYVDQVDIIIPAGNYAGKTVAQLQRALFDGTCAAYEKQNLTFVQYAFELNAFNIGYFMQSKMMEVIYLGALLEVNPFDQPEVELYKTEVRRILGNQSVCN